LCGGLKPAAAFRIAAAGLLALFVASCGGSAGAVVQVAAPPVYGYRVVNTYPHDPQAYTQGLIFIDGFLYESTGQHGRSTVRKVRLETGEVVQRQAVDATYFAEGLTDWRDRLIQITWQTGLGFVYDRASFRVQRTFTYPGEGWGLTHDGKRLILSDGSPEGLLRFIDPDTFREVGRLVVRDRGVPVKDLNELESVGGEIYANVWHTNRIARIAPASGHVVGWIDLTGLLPAGAVTDPEAVLNGIAYDASANRLFVTGKLWPTLFEIRVEPK
jgi:glutaminyl-peptide cyclotransferase